ncbi:MAG: hypothetical protein OEW39_02735 [Deltaproteobacteria bacterium]|nr:hypothetical protein [Deltaproteobacteria bacterium]
MKVSGRTLEFDGSLWVQHAGVTVERHGGTVAVTATDEEAYLKVFNHFGRLLKLYTFEGGRWVDTDTGGDPLPLDEFEAGHLPGIGSEPPASLTPERPKGARRGKK